MRKRLLIGLVSGGLLVAMASPALAGPPAYGCPPSFDERTPKPGLPPDRNGNGTYCQKAIGGGGGGGPALLLIDDHPIGPPG